MASNTETFTTEIYVNQDQANAAMGKLEAQVQKTAKAYEKLLNQKDADPAKTEKAKQAWEQARATLASAERGVEEYGKALKNLSGQSMDRLLKMQKQINAELKKTKPNTEEWKKLSKEYGQVTNRIRDLKKEQEGLINQKGRFASFFEKVGAAGNKFGLALMAIPNLIKTIGSSFRGIIDVTKQVINASQTMGDAWNNGMKAMKSTTEAFFMALSSGDWTAFNDGINAALKKARDLAAQLDLLGDYAISGKVLQSEYMTDFNQQRVTATDTEASEEARRAAIKQMEDDISHYTSFITDQANETWKALEQEFDTFKGIQFETAEEFKDFFVHYFEYGTTARDQSVNNLKAAQDAMKAAQNTIQMYSTSMTQNGDAWVAAYARLEETTAEYQRLYERASKETRAIVAALEIPDSKKQEVQELFSQYRASLDQVTTMQRSFQRTRDKVNRELEKGDETTKKLTKSTDAYAEAIKRIDKAEAAQINTVKQLYAAGLMDKQTYEAQKAAIEEDYLKQRLATAEKYGKDTDKFMSQLLDRQISRLEWAKKQMKEEADEMQHYYENLQAGDAARFGGSSDTGDQADTDAFWEKIYRQAADIRAQITDESARQEYDTKVAWAKKLAEKEILTEEEAQKYILQAKIDYAAKAASQVNSILAEAANFVSALQDAELAQLDADYQKQLTMAGDNAEKREEIEKEYEQKKLDIQKKYADTDMVINIAKTIAAGALAAIQAFAQLGPVGGAVAAALIAATTAAEVAVIVAQRNAIKNSSVNSGGSSGASVSTGNRVISGYSTGGYTDSAASDHKAVGIVHANEWVAPAWMVRSNPVTFANLESYRKSSSHGRTGSAAKGFADGGYTGQQGGVEIYPADVEALVYAAISRAMADGTIRANVVYQDLKSKENQLGRFNSQTSR